MTLPADIDDQLSVIVLGGPGALTSPGIVKLDGHDRNKDWDIQKAKGTTGASAKLNGDPIEPFTCAFTLGGDGADLVDDFVRWDAFQKLVESMTSGPDAIALPIYHPDLARQGITEVTNAGVGGMKHDGMGGATVVVKFLPYKPSKPKATAKALAKPAARGGSRGGNSAILANDPNAAAKAELDRLLAEARKP